MSVNDYSRFWQHNCCIVWYILHHYTVGTNLHIVSNGYLGKYLCPSTNQHIISYSHSSVSNGYLLEYGAITTNYSVMPYDYAIQTMRQIWGVRNRAPAFNEVPMDAL